MAKTTTSAKSGKDTPATHRPRGATSPRTKDRTAPKPPTLADGKTVDALVKKSAERILALTPAERRAMLPPYDAEFSTWRTPIRAAAKSDALATLQAAAAEFIRRYFPDADTANLSVTRYRGSLTGSPVYSTHLAMPVPDRATVSEVLEAAVRDFTRHTNPGLTGRAVVTVYRDDGTVAEALEVPARLTREQRHRR